MEDTPQGPEYVPWIRCLLAPEDHPTWEDDEWLRLDSWESSARYSRQQMAEIAERVAKMVETKEGGQWCGVVRLRNQLPDHFPKIWDERHDKIARDWTEKHVLNGPDGPGRRWLIEQREKRRTQKDSNKTQKIGELI